MGRKKIKIRPIKDDRNRAVCDPVSPQMWLFLDECIDVGVLCR